MTIVNRIRQLVQAWRTALLSLVFVIGLVLSFASIAFAQAGRAADTAAKLQQEFIEANKAYDERRFDEAAEGYRKLVEHGYQSVPIFYNLGNACFRSGDIGSAVLNYRRAWYYAPRDPDIQANLKFALESTGASPPHYPTLLRPFLSMSYSTWIALCVVFYWLSFFSTVGLIVFRSYRHWLMRALFVCVLLLAVSLAGIGTWLDLCRRPEGVVTGAQQEALFAPLPDSTAHFALPEGSIVRILQKDGEWLKIAAGKRIGWVQDSGCKPVCPWQALQGAYADE